MEKKHEGCITCLCTENLFNLFAVTCNEYYGTYAQAIETCFNLKVTSDFKYICKSCIATLEDAVKFKNKTKTIILDAQKTTKDHVEYLDEAILTADECEGWQTLLLEVRKEEEESKPSLQLHVEPTTDCRLCGAELRDYDDHMKRCHSSSDNGKKRKYTCHFCENEYASKKACFTHLRMKHGLKLCNENPKYSERDRKECHVCGRDFSQKQILNNHLLKAHGIEVEKRKAFFCPLCPERVSYGSQFSAHLLHAHAVTERVEQLEFADMDEFRAFKSAIQEQTKYRFRKTTASKQTIEGVRSHYMCSQSGVYVYQGKGKRPTPERQIYKTGKACPAHMVVTETLHNVLVTFYTTHVGHGKCPYYEAREPKRPLAASPGEVGGADEVGGVSEVGDEEAGLEGQAEGGLVCDTCGARLVGAQRMRAHRAAHHHQLYPCDYCGQLYQNVDAWTQHIRAEHNAGTHTF